MTISKGVLKLLRSQSALTETLDIYNRQFDVIFTWLAESILITIFSKG